MFTTSLNLYSQDLLPDKELVSLRNFRRGLKNTRKNFFIRMIEDEEVKNQCLSSKRSVFFLPRGSVIYDSKNNEYLHTRFEHFLYAHNESTPNQLKYLSFPDLKNDAQVIMYRGRYLAHQESLVPLKHILDIQPQPKKFIPEKQNIVVLKNDDTILKKFNAHFNILGLSLNHHQIGGEIHFNFQKDNDEIFPFLNEINFFSFFNYERLYENPNSTKEIREQYLNVGLGFQTPLGNNTRLAYFKGGFSLLSMNEIINQQEISKFSAQLNGFELGIRHEMKLEITNIKTYVSYFLHHQMKKRSIENNNVQKVFLGLGVLSVF